MLAPQMTAEQRRSWRTRRALDRESRLDGYIMGGYEQIGIGYGDVDAH